jgi:hypothetical protein
VVEQTWGPLFIPMDLIPALVEMQAALAPHQHTQLRVAQEIVASVDHGALRVLPDDAQMAAPMVAPLDAGWNRVYMQTRQRHGYLVDYLPKRSPDDLETDVVLPDDVAAHVCPPRAVLEALWRSGMYTAADYDRARATLGTEGHGPVGNVVPPVGATLVLAGTMAETFARAHLLTDLQRHFALWIDADAVTRARAHLHADTERTSLQSWLRVLLERVRQGIEAGHYHVVPMPPDVVEYDADAHEWTALERCLFTLFLYPAQTGDVIWVDDRYVTSFPHRDGVVPIIGVTDVLHWLRSRSTLTDDVYYEKLLALRAANVRLLPLTADEIIYHLQQARIDARGAGETRALQVLRRYLAACLWQGSYLQQPRLDDQGALQTGELAFIMHNHDAALEALRLAWMTSDEASREAHAAWVYTNICVPGQALRTFITRVDGAEEQHFLASLDMVELLLLVVAASFLPDAHPDAEKERAFHAWVIDRFVVPRCSADPLLAATVAERIRLVLTDRIDQADTEHDRAIVIMQAHALYEALPDFIQSELAKDAEYMARLGYRLAVAATIGPYSIERHAFIKAVMEVVNDRQRTMTVQSGDTMLTVRACTDPVERGAVCLEDRQMGHVIGVTDLELLLLHDSAAEREATLRRNRHWFDRPAPVVEQVIAEIASLDEPERRVEAGERWRTQSLSVFYTTLFKRVRAHQELAYEDMLPPDIDEVLWHLRIDPTTVGRRSWRETLEAGAKSLLADVGLLETLQRFASLPVPLPAVVIDACTTLTPTEQRVLVKQLLRTAGSPLSLIHLIRICGVVQTASPALPQLVRRLVRALLGTMDGDAMTDFLAVLRWVDHTLGRRHEVRWWPPAQRLAVTWSHAHHLCRVYAAAGIAPGQLDTLFDVGDEQVSPELFERNPQYWSDSAHPLRVRPATLVLDGVAYGLTGAETLLTPELHAHLAAIAFPYTDDQPFPNVVLLDALTGMPSGLPSFVGGDRGTTLTPLLQHDTSVLAAASLAQHVEAMCDRIMQDAHDIQAWAVLFAILHDRQPPAPVVEQVARVIHRTDFVGAVTNSAAADGLFILQTAALQAPYLPHAAQQHLRDALVPIARFLAAQGMRSEPSIQIETAHQEEDAPDPRASMLQVVQTLSLTCTTGGEAVQLFSTMLIDIVGVWPDLARRCRPIVTRLWAELPTDQAHHLWPLVLYIRAIS